MDWEAIGAIGELLSAVAVLATLVYLAIQVRGMRAGLNADSIREVLHTDLSLINLDIENADLLAKANGGENLDSSEMARVLRLYDAHATVSFHGWLRARVLGYTQKVAAREFARVLLENHAFMEIHKERRSSQHPDRNVNAFLELVDSFVERGEVKDL